VFCFAKREGAGLDDDRLQLGSAAAMTVIEVYEPTPPWRQRLLKVEQRFPARDTMFPAQMVDRANQAVPTMAVMIPAACPVCAVREKLQQQIEELHRVPSFCLGHWLAPNSKREEAR
jgi:hypothetical protein